MVEIQFNNEDQNPGGPLFVSGQLTNMFQLASVLNLRTKKTKLSNYNGKKKLIIVQENLSQSYLSKEGNYSRQETIFGNTVIFALLFHIRSS